jgi:hypothetical protein
VKKKCGSLSLVGTASAASEKRLLSGDLCGRNITWRPMRDGVARQ